MALTDRWQRRRRDRRHARWLGAARAGDTGSLLRLYREVYDPVADYIVVRAPTPEDRDDLIATVFSRFLQNLAQYDARRGSVVAWVIGMARHALIDHLRRRRPALPVEDLAELLAGGAPDPLEQLIRNEETDRVRRLLDQLPAAVREMFAMYYGQGLRYGEIGALLGMSEAAVKQRFSRVRRELRARLQENESPSRTAGRAQAAVRATEGEV